MNVRRAPVTGPVKTKNLSTSQTTYVLGSSADSWGHIWTQSQLSDANFVVRVTDVSSSTSVTFRLDALAATIYYHYTDPSMTNKGPCDYAANQATAAKAAGIELFTIGFGVEGAVCSSDTSSSPYYNVLATTLLAKMATSSVGRRRRRIRW